MTDGASLREVRIGYIHRSFLDLLGHALEGITNLMSLNIPREIYHGCQRGNLCETASKDVVLFVLAVLIEEKNIFLFLLSANRDIYHGQKIRNT